MNRPASIRSKVGAGRTASAVALAVAFGLAVTPVDARADVTKGVSAPTAKKAPVRRAGKATAPKVSRSRDEVADPLAVGTLGSFTPSILDPLGGTLPFLRGSGRAQTSEQTFRFTPSGKVGDRRSLTLGITSRAVGAPEPAPASPAAAVATSAAAEPATPVGYNFGLDVGYHGFSLSGGYSRVDGAFAGIGLLRREALDLGLSYRGRGWKTSLQVGSEDGRASFVSPFDLSRRYSVELGGAYALSPQLSLSGGVRYQTGADGVTTRLDENRADGSVYLGTAFSF